MISATTLALDLIIWKYTNVFTSEKSPTPAINAHTQAKHLVTFGSTWQGSTERNQIFEEKKQQQKFVLNSSTFFPFQLVSQLHFQTIKWSTSAQPALAAAWTSVHQYDQELALHWVAGITYNALSPFIALPCCYWALADVTLVCGCLCFWCQNKTKAMLLMPFHLPRVTGCVHWKHS